MTNHILNILTFPHPEPIKIFGFKTIKLNGYSPLRKGEFPKELLEQHIKELQTTEFLYTDFSTTEYCTYTAAVNLSKSVHFAKHYYNFLIYNYFKSIADLVFPNFVSQTEIWFLDKQQSNSNLKHYNKYILSVQFALVSDQPELVVAFDGTSKVLTKSVQKLVTDNIDTKYLNWVAYNGEIIRYDDLPADAYNFLEKIYPVLNPELSDALHWVPAQPLKNGKKYKFYFDRINQLLIDLLNNDAFKAIIPHSGIWLQLKEDEVHKTSEGTNLLKFGLGTDIDPYEGLKKFKPCVSVPPGQYKFFFINHESDIEAANTFHRYSVKKLGFINFSEFLSLPITYDKDKHILFKDFDNPLPEIKAKLESTDFEPNIKYIAIYISPYNKFESDPVKRNFYYQVKQELLRYKITSQVIFSKNITLDSFKYSVANIAIAILAKLGGVPWHLDREINNELIVGIGAFKTKKYNIRFLGSTFSFSNDGTFNRFDNFPAEDLKSLAASIGEAVVSYRETNQQAER